jgi:hypothetical protein
VNPTRVRALESINIFAGNVASDGNVAYAQMVGMSGKHPSNTNDTKVTKAFFNSSF